MIVPRGFTFEFFNLFCVLLLLTPYLATGFFFIEVDLENDGLGEILGNDPLQYSCVKNPMNRKAIIHRVPKSPTGLK